MKEALRPYLSSNDVIVGVGRQDAQLSQGSDNSLCLHNKHSSAQRISNTVGEAIWNSYFTFSFVRHPFDRLVSLYEFFNRVRRNNTSHRSILKRLFSSGQTIPLENYPDKPPWTWAGMQALLTTTDFSGFIRSEYLARAQGAKPQVKSLTSKSGYKLVDFVGKVENISDDWKKICAQLGIQPPLPHTNRSKRQFENVRQYWSEDNLQFAAEKYREDLEMFGYSVDGFLDP